MLIHVTPRLYLPFRNQGAASVRCRLIDLEIAELGIKLQGGEDLVARCPYPNKDYLVACRNAGQLAVDGLLIETSGHVGSFTTVARWAVGADMVLTHRTNHVVLDQEFDAVSDNMVLWHAMSSALGGWASRTPEYALNLAPASAQPRMDHFPVAMGGAPRIGEVQDGLATSGLITDRTEIFRMPTLERQRVLTANTAADRMPALVGAFQGSAPVQQLRIRRKP